MNFSLIYYIIIATTAFVAYCRYTIFQSLCFMSWFPVSTFDANKKEAREPSVLSGNVQFIIFKVAMMNCQPLWKVCVLHYYLLRICSACRRQMLFFLSSFMINIWFSTWATRRVPIMEQDLLIFPFVQSFVFILYLCCNGIVCLFIFCSPYHCIYVCLSLIYSFWLPFW